MKVFCRVAPLRNGAEPADVMISGSRGNQTVTVMDSHTGSWAALGCHAAFAAVPVPASQQEVYEAVALPLLLEAVRGERCALLAYGQTSSGKTMTIFGPDGGNTKYFAAVDGRGVLPRIASDLFEYDVRFVEIGFLELYNEVATDLVARQLCEGPAPGLALAGAAPRVTYKATERTKLLQSMQRVTCMNAAQCQQVIEELAALRHVASTDGNVRSSRSHAIIQLRLHCEGTRGRPPGQLTLVDLAGSESLRPNATASFASSEWSMGTGVSAGCDTAAAPGGASSRAARAAETKTINTSLFALKKVVHALHRRSEHIPFKDSLLTAVLEEALRSPSTALIVCCSSDRRDAAETMSTMRFASEASRIPPQDTAVVAHRISQRDAALEAVQRAALQQQQLRITHPPTPAHHDASTHSHVLNGQPRPLAGSEADSAECFAAAASDGCDSSDAGTSHEGGVGGFCCRRSAGDGSDSSEFDSFDMHEAASRHSDSCCSTSLPRCLTAARDHAHPYNPDTSADASGSRRGPPVGSWRDEAARLTEALLLRGATRHSQRAPSANSHEDREGDRELAAALSGAAAAARERDEVQAELERVKGDTRRLLEQCDALADSYQALASELAASRAAEAMARAECEELRRQLGSAVCVSDQRCAGSSGVALRETTNSTAPAPRRRRVVSVHSPSSVPQDAAPARLTGAEQQCVGSGGILQRRLVQEQIEEDPRLTPRPTPHRPDPLSLFQEVLVQYESPERPANFAV